MSIIMIFSGKKGKNIFASLDVSGHLGNILFFSEKSNFIPYFGPGLEKKGKKYLCVFGRFKPFGGYFIFAEKKYLIHLLGLVLCSGDRRVLHNCI